MKSTPAVARVQTIAVDLAKEVFQLACADQNFRVVQSLRLKRDDFLKFWHNRSAVHVVMEACGSAHHFGRWLTSMGHRVSLLPAQYVRAYGKPSWDIQALPSRNALEKSNFFCRFPALNLFRKSSKRQHPQPLARRRVLAH